MKYIIGVVGESGAGKGTLSSIFSNLSKKRKVSIIKFSDILFKTLALWNLAPTRENLQNLPIAFVEKFGERTLTNAVRNYISQQKSEIVIVEGVRWLSDVPMIRSFKDNNLVYVTADPKTRFKRMKLRGEKAGEDKKTYQQFLEEEKAATEINISKIGKSADFKITNNGDLDELKKQVKIIYYQMFEK